MTIISAVDARANFADLVNRSAYGKERIAIARRGKALVALVPIEDLEIIEAVEDQLDLEEAGKALKEPGGNIPLEGSGKAWGFSLKYLPDHHRIGFSRIESQLG